MTLKHISCILTGIIILNSCSQKDDIDLLISNGIIHTGDTTLNKSYSIAINNGRILELGPTKELRARYKPNNDIDAKGNAIFPGFIDAHCHFSGYALDAYKCDLVGTNSFMEVLNKVYTYSKTNKLDWIYGRGWDQNDWEVKQWPNKKELDSLFPEQPVILKRIDGHALLCNQRALDLAGINAQTKIEGGDVQVANGLPTGILVDNAMEPVEHLIGKLPKEEGIKYLQQLQQECFSLGLTGVVDCGVTKDIIEILQDLYQQKKLSINNVLLLASDSLTLTAYVNNGPVKNNQFAIAGIKVYGDGALGSRGACLLKDYSDMPGHRGTILTPLAKMEEIAGLAKAHNLQLCTHAIGDSANRMILKLYGKILGNKNDKRWRIEHAQVIDYQDIDLFGAYSIIPSVQPTHATSDAPWAAERLGSTRVKEAYAYKALLKQNGWLPLGTDFPVEQINPINTFYAAVVRKDKTGNPINGFQTQNALSREEALKGMTIWAAKSVFQENNKGSISKGKDADIVILDRDIMKVPEKDILATKVLYTISQGNIVYRKK